MRYVLRTTAEYDKIIQMQGDGENLADAEIQKVPCGYTKQGT
jgi:hypothetical protein